MHLQTIYGNQTEKKKIKGSDTTPAHQMSDFKFKDYCPQIFRQLREWFRISTQEYLVTICGDFKLLEFISNSKSGQFFFFSHNSQFIIKTMTRTESIFLRKILPSYYQYVSQQPDTLLPKFYGMHRVKRKKQKIYFLIQQNVFFSDVDDIHDQYDLKVLCVIVLLISLHTLTHCVLMFTTRVRRRGGGLRKRRERRERY